MPYPEFNLKSFAAYVTSLYPGYLSRACYVLIFHASEITFLSHLVQTADLFLHTFSVFLCSLVKFCPLVNYVNFRHKIAVRLS